MSDPRNDSGRVPLVAVAAALLCVVGHGIGPAGGQSTQPASAPAEEEKRPKISTVLGTERVADADILILRNGDKLTGTIGNPSFTIRTAYATVQLPASKLAGVDLEADAFGLEAFLTVNASRFSGFVTESLASALRASTMSRAEFRMAPTCATPLRTSMGSSWSVALPL